jgi:uncharacterized damage-inducible protein DinB
MTAATQLLADAFGRIRGVVHGAVDGLTDDDLTFTIDDGANSISWLVWHLTRVQDHYIAGLVGAEEVWGSGGWFDRFHLPFPATATGYGHSAADVAAVRGVSATDLVAYHDAVCARTLEYLDTLGDDALDEVVDTAWNPPVTLGVRLVSMLSDDLQHAGQAAFVRGVLQRRA